MNTIQNNTVNWFPISSLYIYNVNPHILYDSENVTGLNKTCE